MPPARGKLEQFVTELNSEGLRIALLPKSEHASAIRKIADTFPEGRVRDFALSTLGMSVASATNQGMKPKDYFTILAIAFGFLLGGFAVAICLIRYAGCTLREALSLTFGGLFFVSLLAINLAVPNPTSSQQRAFNVYLALAAAAVGAGLPGFISLESKTTSTAISAGGALALFLIVLWWRPVGEKK